MTHFIIIFIAFLGGYLCQRIERFPRSTGHSLNLFIIYVSLPSMVLSRLPELFHSQSDVKNLWLPIAMAWSHFIFAFLIIFKLSQILKWSRPKTGALLLTVGLGNTSFVGFPILESLLGPQAIPIGILADQPGSFLVLSTLGVFVAASFSGANTRLSHILRRVFQFPPFITMLIAAFWAILGQPGASFLNPVFDKFSATLFPLALFSVGFQTQFQLSVIRKRFLPLSIGLSLKLLLLPALFYVLIFKLLNLNDLVAQVTLLESAMATQITAAIVASEFNLDTELANLMVGLSIPLSLVTVPLWHFWIGI